MLGRGAPPIHCHLKPPSFWKYTGLLLFVALMTFLAFAVVFVSN